MSWIIIPLWGWRALLAISAVPAFVMLFFRRNMPESPRYLLLAGTAPTCVLEICKNMYISKLRVNAFAGDVAGAQKVLVEIAQENGLSQDRVDRVSSAAGKLRPITSHESVRLRVSVVHFACRSARSIFSSLV